MMEAAPSAAFIVTKPDLLLELLVVALDTPAQFGKIDEPAEAKVCRQRREPILGRLGSPSGHSINSHSSDSESGSNLLCPTRTHARAKPRPFLGDQLGGCLKTARAASAM